MPNLQFLDIDTSQYGPVLISIVRYKVAHFTANANHLPMEHGLTISSYTKGNRI